MNLTETGSDLVQYKSETANHTEH